MAPVRLTKRDDALWLKHLREVGILVPPGARVLLKLGNHEVEFLPMRLGSDGRATLGLRAAGVNRSVWLNVSKGTVLDGEMVRLLEPADYVTVSDARQSRDDEVRYQVRRESGSQITELSLFDDVEKSAERVTEFDAYVIVDWSAWSKPKVGPDSIWWCVCEWGKRQTRVTRIENSPTRAGALAAVRLTLLDLFDRSKSILVAFDFPYGYPAGLAQALGLTSAPWRAVWDEIKCRITDDQANHLNNRFRVASDLNCKIGAPAGPFWGHPATQSFTHLRPMAPNYPVRGLVPLRITEQHARTAQPAWKLYGNGSVGGQALLGIPCLATIRDDLRLRRESAVWPFETGSMLPPRPDGPRIVHAEIYPSLVELPVDLGGRVKDRAQVEAIATYLARHDANATLTHLFAAPAGLSASARNLVETEEGWILGVTF